MLCSLAAADIRILCSRTGTPGVHPSCQSAQPVALKQAFSHTLTVPTLGLWFRSSLPSRTTASQIRSRSLPRDTINTIVRDTRTTVRRFSIRCSHRILGFTSRTRHTYRSLFVGATVTLNCRPIPRRTSSLDEAGNAINRYRNRWARLKGELRRGDELIHVHTHAARIDDHSSKSTSAGELLRLDR